MVWGQFKTSASKQVTFKSGFGALCGRGSGIPLEPHSHFWMGGTFGCCERRSSSYGGGYIAFLAHLPLRKLQYTSKGTCLSFYLSAEKFGKRDSPSGNRVLPAEIHALFCLKLPR